MNWELVFVLVILIGGYLLPAFIAIGRGHQSAAAIVILDLVLGWTLLGWFIALLWALSGLNKRAGPAAG